MAICKRLTCGLPEEHAIHQKRHHARYHPFEPEDAAPAPMPKRPRGLGTITGMDEGINDYSEPSPQAEEGGDHVVDTNGSISNNPDNSGMAERKREALTEAGARVAGCVHCQRGDEPGLLKSGTGNYWHKIDGVLYKCDRNWFKENSPEPVAQPGAGGEPHTTWPDCRDFYELMQKYRHWPIDDQAGVTKAFRDVINYIRKPAAPAEQPFCAECNVTYDKTDAFIHVNHKRTQPIAGQVNAEQWLKRQDVFDMRWRWADPASGLSKEQQRALLLEAYAAHVTKGLEARLQINQELNVKGAEWAGYAMELKSAKEAAEARNAELMGMYKEQKQLKEEYTAQFRQADTKVVELMGELERAKQDANDWKRHFEMYRNAWIRELGGWTIPKSHEIDSLVLTTRKRCVNPLLGNCATPHWLGEPTSDKKALQQTAHPQGNSCREWKADASEPNPRAEAAEKRLAEAQKASHDPLEPME